MGPAPKKKKKARKRPVFYVGAFVLSLVLTVLIIEVVMALLGSLLYSPPDLPEIHGAPPQGMQTFHIICLGDSHTYGYGVPPEKSYPNTLQRLMNDRAGGALIAAYNMGSPGKNSSEALADLERFVDSSPVMPDLVVVCVGKNNMTNLRHASILPEKIRDLPLSKRLDFMLSNSGTYRLTRMTVQRFRELRESGTTEQDVKSFRYGEFVPARDEPFLYDWALQDFRTAADICDRLDINLVLMTYYMHIGFVDDAMQKAAEERENVYFVDQRFPVGAYAGYWSTLVSWPDQHPNAKGYYRIALILADRLVDRGLVPWPEE